MESNILTNILFSAGRVINLYKRAIAALKDAKTANEVDLETLSQQMLDYADRLASPSEAETLRAEHFDKYNQYKEGASSKRSIEGSGNTPNAKRAKTVVHTAQGRSTSSFRPQKFTIIILALSSATSYCFPARNAYHYLCGLTTNLALLLNTIRDLHIHACHHSIASPSLHIGLSQRCSKYAYM